jgi:hypothetical protein
MRAVMTPIIRGLCGNSGIPEPEADDEEVVDAEEREVAEDPGGKLVVDELDDVVLVGDVDNLLDDMIVDEVDEGAEAESDRIETASEPVSATKILPLPS